MTLGMGDPRGIPGGALEVCFYVVHQVNVGMSRAPKPTAWGSAAEQPPAAEATAVDTSAERSKSRTGSQGSGVSKAQVTVKKPPGFVSRRVYLRRQEESARRIESIGEVGPGRFGSPAVGPLRTASVAFPILWRGGTRSSYLSFLSHRSPLGGSVAVSQGTKVKRSLRPGHRPLASGEEDGDRKETSAARVGGAFQWP